MVYVCIRKAQPMTTPLYLLQIILRATAAASQSVVGWYRSAVDWYRSVAAASRSVVDWYRAVAAALRSAVGWYRAAVAASRSVVGWYGQRQAGVVLSSFIHSLTIKQSNYETSILFTR